MSTTPHDASFDDDDLLFSNQFDDHFFSRHDGRAETDHVFIKGNRLPERWLQRNRFVIGELGFGTGLNLLETWRQWRENRAPGQHLTFVSVEAFFLEESIAGKALSQWPELAQLTAKLLEKWGVLPGETALDQQTTLIVHRGSADQCLGAFPTVDAWYLDGFAPAKNPDMWSLELMQQVARRTSPGGTCASYTAAGWVRRNLETAGFVVEKRPGFGTKRDMVIGTKL